jgi:hypothetical protein
MNGFLKYDPLRLSDHRKHTGDYYFIVKKIYMNSKNSSLTIVQPRMVAF